MLNSKKSWAFALLLVNGFMGIVEAHTQPGAIGRTKSKAGGTDIYEVTCFNANDGTGDPDHLYVDVKDMRPRNPALVSIQATVSATGIATPVSIDTKDSDAFPSAGNVVAGAGGPYIMTVQKSRSRLVGKEVYIAEFHCQSATGNHTGTDWRMIQNQ